MWRIISLALLGILIVVFGFSLIDGSGGDDVSASALLAAPDSDIGGFQRAIDIWDWQFPADHGAHPNFQTEWWYYTGNLATEDGRRFGFQFTIFRRAILPDAAESNSEWRSNQIYMAHFTVTDVAGNRFYHDQRFSRGGAELAGAVIDPAYRVWLEDWQIVSPDDNPQMMVIQADSGVFAIDLTMIQIKPPALQGDNGLSAKSDEPGNASYYYSLTRLDTSGTIRVNGETFTVQGASWMDHEFSTSALGDDALGWDWFGLHLDDGREVMVGQIRLTDDSRDPYFGGLLVNADGSTESLDAADFTITATGTWTSPHSGAIYPAGWEIVIMLDDGETLSLTLTPLIDDQELHGGGIVYWEGAVRITGDVTGYGYAELTGYADAMTGRF